MMDNPPDILSGSILIVDDQAANVQLLEQGLSQDKGKIGSQATTSAEPTSTYLPLRQSAKASSLST